MEWYKYIYTHLLYIYIYSFSDSFPLFSLPGFSVHGILQAKILQSRLLFLSSGDLPDSGSNLGLPHCRQILHCLNNQESLYLLLQNIKYSFLCYILGPWWLSILYIVLCIYPHYPQDWKKSVFIPILKKDNPKLSHNCTHLACWQSNAQNSPSQASTVCAPWTSRCSSWV